MDREKIEKNLRRDEGYALDVYPDVHGNLTVGIGHLVLPGDSLRIGDIISGFQVLNFFQHDLQHAEIGARYAVKDFDTLHEDIQNVLVEMCFNLGPTKLRKFKKMIMACNAGDYKTMAKEISDSSAAKQLPKRYADYQRRIEEIAIV